MFLLSGWVFRFDFFFSVLGRLTFHVTYRRNVVLYRSGQRPG
jgi:hypothetical protein